MVSLDVANASTPIYDTLDEEWRTLRKVDIESGADLSTVTPLSVARRIPKRKRRV